MNWRRIKLEFFHLRKAFLQYHRGWRYICNKFFLAKKILYLKRVIERPATYENLSMHTMLGHQHLLMALWSLASYYAVSHSLGKLYLHGDGTLTARDEAILNKFFPQAEIVDPIDVLTRYAEKYDKYPRLKEFRIKHRDNFFQTKLIDPLVISDKEIRLFFDIDILWFKNPEVIQRELESNGEHSLMMSGTFSGEDSEHNLVYFKDGSRLDAKYSNFNGGIMLYHKKNLPVEKLADYLESLDMSRPESQHWVEQAGYAYNMQNLQKLQVDQYPIKGDVDERVVARHYTGPRRVEFYTEGLPLIKKLVCN